MGVIRACPRPLFLVFYPLEEAASSRCTRLQRALTREKSFAKGRGMLQMLGTKLGSMETPN